MKPVFVVLFAVCVIASAMVPRDRRAVDTEDQENAPSSEPSARICDPTTPCGWIIYKPAISFNITNSYCKCAEGTVCKVTEDDKAVNAFVLCCRPPEATTEAEEPNSES